MREFLCVLQLLRSLKGDHLILQKLELDENEHEAIEHLIVQMEKERGLDRSAAIADMRFNFIEKGVRKR